MWLAQDWIHDCSQVHTVQQPRIWSVPELQHKSIVVLSRPTPVHVASTPRPRTRGHCRASVKTLACQSVLELIERNPTLSWISGRGCRLLGNG